MRKEIRVIGIDDSPFDKRSKKPILIVGTVFRGGTWMDGVLSTFVEQDGDDATEKIAAMINRSKFASQIRAIFLNGITVAGFNVIDVPELARQTKKAVIVIVRAHPNYDEIFAALKKIKQEHKIALIKKIPPPTKINKIYVQAVGYTPEEVTELLTITCTRAHIPEPLRVAHLIAAGIVTGESKGRA